jgi:hypothetical protein
MESAHLLRDAGTFPASDEEVQMVQTLSPSGGKRYLRRADAAAYVTDHYGFPCSRQWLAKLAVLGGGPVFRKAGRYPIYSPDDLDRWAQARIGPAQHSTTETADTGSKATEADRG